MLSALFGFLSQITCCHIVAQFILVCKPTSSNLSKSPQWSASTFLLKGFQSPAELTYLSSWVFELCLCQCHGTRWANGETFMSGYPRNSYSNILPGSRQYTSESCDRVA